MGLDGVEILMAAEEAFGIEIPDKVAESLFTPGALIDFIAQQVDAVPTDRRYAQRLFYRLRRGFRTQIPAPVARFDPKLPLADVVHKDQWPRVWAAVRSEVGEPHWPENIPWPGLFRDGPKTVEELVWTVVEALPPPPAGMVRTWTRDQVEAQVRSIITEVTGVKAFRLRHRFVQDIGID